jgi:hypothetical protein
MSKYKRTTEQRREYRLRKEAKDNLTREKVECWCGCGQVVRKGRKFIQGHNASGISRAGQRMGHIVTQETRDKISNKLMGHTHSEETRKKIGLAGKGKRPLLGTKRSSETIKKMSESRKALNLVGEKSASWKYGSYSYWHSIARKQFGKEVCDCCGMTQEESLCTYNHILDMHCVSLPKNYQLMEETNWSTLCRGCHIRLERTLKAEKMPRSVIEAARLANIGRKHSEAEKKKRSDAIKKSYAMRRQLAGVK